MVGVLVQAEWLAAGLAIWLMWLAGSILLWCLIIWIFWALGANAWKVKKFLVTHEALNTNVAEIYNVVHAVHVDHERLAKAFERMLMLQRASNAWDAMAAPKVLGREDVLNCAECRGPYLGGSDLCPTCGHDIRGPAAPAAAPNS